MGATSQGLPYPAASDPVAQGADAIRLLAAAVDALVVAGLPVRVKAGVCVMRYTAGTVLTEVVQYTTPFAAGETVLCFVSNGGGTQSAKAVIQAAPWASGLLSHMNIRAYNGDGAAFAAGAAVTVFWVAVAIRSTQGGARTG